MPLKILKIGGGGGGGPGAPVVAGAYYAGGDATIQAVAATPGWVVLAEFDLDVAPSSAELDAIALVSAGALTLNLKLYDVTAAADVPGSDLTTSDTTGARLTTADLIADLVEGNRYQILAEVVGGTGAANFGRVRYAVLSKVP